MENASPLQQENEQVQIDLFPPKYEKKPESSNVWAKSALSLAAYLILGYYIFPSYSMLFLITTVVMIHELGHFIAMKLYRYRDLGIFFIPLLGAYVSGNKREISQKESAVILLAGPVPGIVIGAVFFMLYEQNPYFSIWGLSNYTIGVAFILLNLINLLPVYPLDGGQLLNRVFLDEDSWVSKLFVLLSVAFMTWFALFGTSRPFYPLLLFPLMMVLRMFGDSKLKQVEKKVEEESFDLDKSYADLTNEEYWKIRTVVVTQHPSFRDVHEGPPYNYDEKEERIMTMIESLLHRHLIQDMTLIGKLLIILLWLFSFAIPWLLGIYQSILSRFGF